MLSMQSNIKQRRKKTETNVLLTPQLVILKRLVHLKWQILQIAQTKPWVSCTSRSDINVTNKFKAQSVTSRSASQIQFEEQTWEGAPPGEHADEAEHLRSRWNMLPDRSQLPSSAWEAELMNQYE